MEPHPIPALPDNYRLVSYPDHQGDEPVLVVELQRVVATIWSTLGRRITHRGHSDSENDEAVSRLAVDLIDEHGVFAVPRPGPAPSTAVHPLVTAP